MRAIIHWAIRTFPSWGLPRIINLHLNDTATPAPGVRFPKVATAEECDQ